MAVLILSSLPDDPMLPAVLIVSEQPRTIVRRARWHRHVRVTLAQDGDRWWIHRRAIISVQPDLVLEQPDEQQDDDDEQNHAAADIHATEDTRGVRRT